MKNFIILFFSLFALNAFAVTEVDVLSAEYAVKDYNQEGTLCLTVIRVPDNGSLLGVVEDIGDCYYARLARRSYNHKLALDLNKLQKIEHTELREHLQKLDTQLEFYFSDGE